MERNKPILVPLDGSKIAENAVPVAACAARAFDCPVRFIHVLPERDYKWTKDDAARATEQFVPYAKDLATKNGIEVTDDSVTVARGDPAQVILAAADEAALVVIATHGRGGFHATFIGSVADKVVRGATVPVLAVPGIGRPEDLAEARTVLVALDGSPVSEQGLAPGRAVAKALDASVALLRAYSIPPPIGSEFAYYPADYAETLEQGAREYLASIALSGEQQIVAQGWPPAAVVDVAAELDAGLVVMTASGKGLAKRIALGSTTDRVLHSLQRPLLIVPASGEGAAE